MLEEEAELDTVTALSNGSEPLALDRGAGQTRRSAGSEAQPEAPQVQVATGPYTGRLLDPLGRPMAGIEVTIDSWEAASQQAGGIQIGPGRRRKPASGLTDKDGLFSLETKKGLGRSLGLGSVVAGYSDDPIQCVLDPEKGRDLGDVVLEPAVQLTGWIRDADDRAVLGARVRRVERNGDAGDDIMDQLGFGGLVEAARTDADGRFELLHEEEGLVTLKVDGDDILPLRWEGPTKRAGEVLQDVVIHVERAGYIEGHVVGYPKGRRRGLVAAVRVNDGQDTGSGDRFSELVSAQLSPAGDHTGPIEEDGSFKLAGLVPGGEYRLRAIAKKFFVNTVELSNAVEAGVGGGPVSLDFDPGTTVTFQAFDAKSREPVEALSITGRYGSESAYIQLSKTAGDPPDRYGDGKVTIYELRPKAAPKTLTLTIDAPGYYRRSGVTVDVPASGVVNMGKVLLERAPALKFRVVDSATKKPIKRARLTLEPGSSSGRSGKGSNGEETVTLTDEEKEQEEAAEAFMLGGYRVRARGRTDRDGRCTLTMIEGANVSLEVRARKYGTYVAAPFVVPSDVEKEIEIVLFGGSILRAVVTDSDGAVAAGVRVECRRHAGQETVNKAGDTDENGIAEFEHLLPGTWEMRAFRRSGAMLGQRKRGSPSHEAEWVEAHLTRGARSSVELQVPIVVDLSGLVLLGDRPAADARVTLSRPEDAERTEMLLKYQDRFAGLTRDKTTAVTDFEGQFMLMGVVPGEYVLLTRHPEISMVVRTELEVAAGENSIEVKIPSTSLEGRIVDDAGAPVVGAAVSVERYVDDSVVSQESAVRQFLGSDATAMSRTDVNGEYKLLGVRAGVQLTVAVEAAGYADKRHGPLLVMEEATEPVPLITLERSGAIHVTCGGEERVAGLRFASAKATGGRALEDGAADKVGLLKGGSTRLDGLVPGTWEVKVQTQGEDGSVEVLGPVSVKVVGGETEGVEL